MTVLKQADDDQKHFSKPPYTKELAHQRLSKYLMPFGRFRTKIIGNHKGSGEWEAKQITTAAAAK